MAELIVTEGDRVAPGRTMTTTATLYRDGTLKLENTSKSVHFTRGLRGHSLYVILLQNDKALFLSEVHYPPTVAGQGDWFGDSTVKRTYTESVPAVIAAAVNRMDIIHNSGDLHGQWERHRTTIKGAVKDAAEISAEIKKIVNDW